ncbi:MAG: helix-turn-helix domain-containing protein [Candidatus Omnitrophica bacterium]|nr:helix-turn-helix domain-containing protein [Candidatus Omnitrophota bacterium]
MREREVEYITIPQLAQILGVSRIAVYKKVKKGKIKAIKIGRNYLIPKEYILRILGKTLQEEERHQIDKAIKKTVEEYGEVLRLLGRE